MVRRHKGVVVEQTQEIEQEGLNLAPLFIETATVLSLLSLYMWSIRLLVLRSPDA